MRGFPAIRLRLAAFGTAAFGTAVLSAVVLSPASRAQTGDAASRLANAARVDCTFSTVAISDWPDDGAGGGTDDGPSVKTEAADVEASFFDVDVDSGTAEAEGRFGASYIVVRYAEGYLHFLQTLSAGPIYLTTVLAEPAGGGRFKAVHTRHEFTAVSLPGFTSRPEMYVGDCAVE